MPGAAVGVRIVSDETGIGLQAAHRDVVAEMSQTLDAAAGAALVTVRANTPRRTGRAQASWSEERRGPLERAVVSDDVIPKMRWLEGRYRMIARGRQAADRVVSVAYPGYQAPAVSLDPLW